MRAKGISPMIATVILVGMVIAFSGLFINFYRPFQEARQEEIEEAGSAEVECTFASLEFTDEDVDYNLTGSTDYVNVTVDNTGSVDLYDFEVTVWVSDTSYSYPPLDELEFNSSRPLEKGDRAVIVANVTDNLSGTPTDVRVVAKNCPRSAKKVEL